MKKNTTHTVTIEGYSAEGAGVARLEGLVVFIPETIRGERWEILLLKVNKSVAWGKAVELLDASPERIPLDCIHSGKCGGCQFRHMSYKEECASKGQRVIDSLRKIGGIQTELPALLAADMPDRYRNKVQFPVAAEEAPEGEEPGVKIGFFRPRSHDVINVEDCMLQPTSAAVLRQVVYTWMERNFVVPYNEKTGKGLVRHLYLRTNKAGEVLCCLVINGIKVPNSEELIKELRKADNKLVGIVLNVNRNGTNVILGEKYRPLWGQNFLEEELCGLKFKLSVQSFFQINRDQAEVLYAKAVEFAGLTGTETVLDLYCGIGTISLCMAKKAGRVIGGEIVKEAIRDAQQNAERNGISNTEFICGDAGEIAVQLEQDGIRPDVICVDPPRKGLSPEVPAILAAMNAKRIVYVSCDPATLARDVKKFTELGYVFEQGQALDMFPRTGHVETVIALSRTESK